MTNRPRKVSMTGIYHVFVRGINKEQIFNQKREKNYFKRMIRENKDEYHVEIYSYCIMSNHSHLIIKSEIEELSMFMSKILAKYAKYYNYKHNRNGHVFQNRFGSECIENEKYFLNCLRYIHMNPVKAGMVSWLTDYQYSSIREYETQKMDILHKNAMKYYQKIFKDWNTFLEFHTQPNTVLFIDTKEAVYQQLQEQAVLLLYEIKEKYRLAHVTEVFEDPIVREKYKKRLQEELKISLKLREQLYDELKIKFIR